METIKEFTLKNKILKFVNTLDETDKNKIFTNRYFYIPVRGKQQPMISRQNKEEYYSQIQIQLDFLQKTNLTQRDFCEALLEGCRHHILKYKRLIISDLWGQLNITMHILDATNGIFHNHIESEAGGIDLRIFYQEIAEEILIDFIWVPDPNNLGGIGRAPKLVPLKSLK